MQLYQDNFSVISQDDSGILILTWTAKTADMTDEDFKKTNLEFAEQSVKQNARRLLVDMREFEHTFSASLGAWRLQHVIPKYHQAGVDRFAFVHGPNFPEPPGGQKEAGENFISRHFASEAGARAWLLED